jgi:Cyclin, N-terminal domain/Cyclin, C-terminal domain
VAISLSLFDRYLATVGNRCNGNLALLASLTTMHIAIKLHDPKKIKLGTLANLSRGQFGPKNIEQMEWAILTALNWRLHPPTQYAFVAMLLLFLPQEVHSSVRQRLHDVSMYLTELAVCDSYFVDVPCSKVAFAAILVVMEDTSLSSLPGGLREKFLSTLTSKVGLYHNDHGVGSARYRLRKMFASTTFADSCTTPQQQAYYGQDSYSDSTTASVVDDASVSSRGSCLSLRQTKNTSFHSRTNSYDSGKGSCRYSPCLRRSFVASVSPVSCTSRAAVSSSPMIAGIQ